MPMDPASCQTVLCALQLVVAMSVEMREQTRAAIGKEGWKETMDVVKQSPDLAARSVQGVGREGRMG